MIEGSAPRPKSQPEPHHNPALDGVRGLAILCVLGHHLIYVNQQATTPVYVWSRAFIDSLWCGVDIFFALSGFLITGILVRTLSAPGYFRNFYGRRTLRIFPLYYFVLFVLLLCTPWLHIAWGSQIWRLLTYTNHPFPPLHDSQWSFYFGGNISLVNFWSLHIEEQFYLFWPLLVFLFRLPRRLLFVAGGLPSSPLRFASTSPQRVSPTSRSTRASSPAPTASHRSDPRAAALYPRPSPGSALSSFRTLWLRASPRCLFVQDRGLVWRDASPTLYCCSSLFSPSPPLR